MSQLHDFLTWFDGWAENIPAKGPNAKQWGRLKSKVDDMRKVDASAASIVSTVTMRPGHEATDTADEADPQSKPRPAKPKAWTKQAWEGAFVKAMESKGYDADSAKEVMADLFKGTAWSPHLDPATAAAQAASAMMN